MQLTTLIAIVCLAGADPVARPGACVQEIVTDSVMSPSLTMPGCRGIGGQMSALQYVQSHPLYSGQRYELAGWECLDGPFRPHRNA